MARRVIRRPPTAQHVPDAGGLDRFVLTCGDSQAEVIPARGALISRFAVAGDEVLFCERARLRDRGTPPPGGVQVLFPAAGPLDGDRYEAQGRSFPMRAGGLARLAPWQVLDVVEARVLMELRATDISRVSYPFEFALRLAVDLGLAGGQGLSLELDIENRGAVPMPYHLGFLPHFLLSEQDREAARLDSAALQAHDEVLDQPLTLPTPGGVTLGPGEVDLTLLDHVRGPAGRPATLRLSVPGRAPRLLRFSESLRFIGVHGQKFRDFLVLAPWTARRGALQTGQDLRTLAPGQSDHFELLLSVG